LADRVYTFNVRHFEALAPPRPPADWRRNGGGAFGEIHVQPPRVSEFLGLNASALSPSPFAASSESKCWREHRTQVPPASLAKSQRWTFAAGFQRSLIQPRFLTWVGTALLRVPDLRCRPGSTGSLLLVFASFAGFCGFPRRFTGGSSAGFCGFPEVHRRKSSTCPSNLEISILAPTLRK
jgi:hypothetical protein